MTKISFSIFKILASFAMLFAFGASLLAFTSTAPVMAQVQTQNQGSQTGLPSSRCPIEILGDNCPDWIVQLSGQEGVVQFIISWINIFITLLFVICVGAIVYGAYLYQGGIDPDKGQKVVFNSLIGLAIAILSYTLVAIVGAFVIDPQS